MYLYWHYPLTKLDIPSKMAPWRHYRCYKFKLLEVQRVRTPDQLELDMRDIKEAFNGGISMHLLQEKTHRAYIIYIYKYISEKPNFSMNYVSSSETLHLKQLCRCLTWLSATSPALGQTTLHLCFGQSSGRGHTWSWATQRGHWTVFTPLIKGMLSHFGGGMEG